MNYGQIGNSVLTISKGIYTQMKYVYSILTFSIYTHRKYKSRIQQIKVVKLKYTLNFNDVDSQLCDSISLVFQSIVSTILQLIHIISVNLRCRISMYISTVQIIFCGQLKVRCGLVGFHRHLTFHTETHFDFNFFFEFAITPRK